MSVQTGATVRYVAVKTFVFHLKAIGLNVRDKINEEYKDRLKGYFSDHALVKNVS